ncbi:MAG: hypothetical protein JWL77_4372 [Chthonomonadaceae bacterium]|nr:hypothetical protein [Chthonomonadaceae bacterium]
MAAATTDYAAVLEFIDQTKLRDCFLPSAEVPAPLGEERNLVGTIPYLDLGLSAEVEKQRASAGETSDFQVFATGWTGLEGVMLITPEREFDADVRVGLAATNERALRDLLLTFPAGKVGFFYLGAPWMLPVLKEMLDGRIMPSREGYFATASTLLPCHDFPARRLEANDYPLVQTHWSEGVWQELQEGGYRVHACQEKGAELDALCFHWQVSSWRNEVHGLQAVKSYARPYAECVITSATTEVIEQGRVATCTANLASNEDYVRAFQQIGYRPFYRVLSYLGIKRGSGKVAETSIQEFYGLAGRRPPQEKKEEAKKTGEGIRIHSSKDPLLVQFSDLAHAAGRKERSQFVAEGVTLVQRAINDGVPADSLLYTPVLLSLPEGSMLLHAARRTGIPHYLVTEGMMARVTTTRPVPPVLAALFTHWRAAEGFAPGKATTLLIAEDIHNPDNLGMILRTADAAGVEGVIVVGESSDPFHKNCVRAARGAVGRIPILSCRSLEQFLQRLQTTGCAVIGAALGAKKTLFQCEMQPPIAVVVGNEQRGISRPVLDVCSAQVQIPMAPGQDSLNVGVATGLMLYEIFRQKTMPTAASRETSIL